MSTKSLSISCYECDNKHECEIISCEFDNEINIPEYCQVCGASMISEESDYREDFHSDG